MTISLLRAARPLPAAALAVLVLSACSFSGSVKAATSSALRSSGSAAVTSGVVAAGTSAAGASSSHTGTTARPAASSPAGTTTARTDRCHTSELTGSLTAESAGAGQRYATLLLRNTGGRTCTVYGFGGLGLAASDGHALPTHQVRSGGPAATVVLSPGGTVRSALHWGAVNGPGDSSSGACQPDPATLRVIPPDETDALSVAWTLGPVCSAGTIEQHPYTS